MRDGTMSPRDGFSKLGNVISLASLPGLVGSSFQGDFDYVPSNGTPYKIYVIGGHVLKVDPSFQTAPIDLSAVSGHVFQGTTTKACFTQAGIYLVIQSGNYNPATNTGDLPFFWNGVSLTRSNGITGVTQVGPSIPTVYIVNPSANWGVPPVGNNINILLSGSYGGNVGDVVTISVAPYSTGPDAGKTIGIFKVVGTISGGITVNCLSLSGTAPGIAGTPIPASDNPLLFTVTLPPNTTQAVTLSWNTLGTMAGVNLPGPAATATITLGAGQYYPGHTNDLITIQDTSNVAQGTYQIISFSTSGTATITLKNIGATSPTGSTALQFIVIDWGNGDSPSLGLLLASTSVYPTLNYSVTLPFSANYIGSIGDVVSIPVQTSGGTVSITFQVLAFPVIPFPSWMSGIPVTLQPLQSTGAEGPFPFNNPQIMGLFSTSFTLTIISSATGGGTNINQIPSAGAMTYYMGRIWYASGKTANAGDIVGGPSGTLANNYQDSVLAVTENPLVLGGDGFTMPSGNDNITGFAIPQMINASLGEGLLNIGTANAIFALQVPVTRADWIAADSNNAPQIFVVQQSNGFVNDWSCVGVNGDIWFQSLTPDIRSLLTAVRYFEQWGNVDLSSNETRILSQTNRTLLGWSSGIYFSNRLWMTTTPQQTPYGVVHPNSIPLDFEPISTMEEQLPPNWEGQSMGLQIMKMSTATFNGVQRAFFTVLSTQVPGQIELWEMIPDQVGDNGKRISWQAFLPSFTWAENNMELIMKKLVSGEMWLDNIQGVVDIEIQYVPDGSACVYDWYKFSVCNATDSSQLTPSEGYPLIKFQPGVRRPIVFPMPPEANSDQTGRPSYIGYEFQPIITVTGQCNIRGFFLKAEGTDRPLYEGLESQ